ncbi:carbohydrate ABC transporter permease [Lederbergia citrea]|uniref:carbohydrate ABC transporter permease n=1 Tax=Lederbergia citrea TaxID=2833581 RepID=UPI001BC999EF|nr:carbohydrate ABC transporter permease [Lederbergia citrea]MBS4179386.1 carbohydrate ABC transporter permease [Lederbergia citrea]
MGRTALKVISYVGLTILSLLTFLPILWMVLTALKPENEVFSTELIGSELAWNNFYNAWTSLPFGQFFLNSIIVTAAVTFLEVATSSLAAYAFARLKFKGRDLLFYLYLGTLMVPAQVVLIPQYILMDKLSWVDTYQALILPMAFTAFGTFLLRQFFLTIPYELEEAAKMDGCSRFRLYFQIILPLAKPALATLAVFSFVSQWNNFFWPLIITNTAEMQTLTVGLRMFQGIHGTEWHLMMAASTITIIPTLLVFVFFQRYLAEGITISGIAGR